MKLLFLMFSALLTVASGDEPPLVRAVVRELTHDPTSAPLENRNVLGKPPPVWTVRLEVLDVLRGDPKLKGQAVITASADTVPQGNGRFVVPRLNEGDVGIWAIKQLADDCWAEDYSPYEVEKDIRLPLIKGRHDVYERVLSRLSGDQAPQSSGDVTAQEEPPTPAPAANPAPLLQPPPASKQAPGSKPPSTPSDEPTSSTPWGIIVVLILAATGLLWLLLKRRS